MRLSTCLLTAVCLWAATGCAKQPTDGRQPVSGKVTLKGAPLDNGSIQFLLPDAGGGALSGGVISKGEYSIDAKQGLPVGKYKVFISAAASGASATEEMPGDAGPEAEELIPPEFNVNSDKTVEVAANKENVFNFDIP